MSSARPLPPLGVEPSPSIGTGPVVDAPHPNGAHGHGGDPTGPPPFARLRDLLDDPEMLQAPEEVLPRLAWRGRATLLVGPDKAGKSTLATHGVAALTQGLPWLGARPEKGTAIIAAPDEAVGDTVRRLVEAGADPDRVRLLVTSPPQPLGVLTEALAAEPADVVVVDSLAEWARLTRGEAPDDGDTAGWGAVIRPLVQLAREVNLGLLLLHHPRRSDGQYRGSGEIAAAVDVLREMLMPQVGEDPTLRRFRGRARFQLEDFSVRLEDGQYVLGGGGIIALEARVLLDVSANPGTTRADSYRRLGGKKSTHVAAINQLLGSDALVDRDGALYRPEDVEEDLW